MVYSKIDCIFNISIYIKENLNVKRIINEIKK